MLQMISVILEGVVVLLALMLALKKGNSLGWYLALTYAVYVFYDTANLFMWKIPQEVLSVSFFVATSSILIGAWKMYTKS